MNNPLVLDTNILIALLAGILDIESIDNIFPEHNAFASFMTRVELLSYSKITEE
jgi:hypothetical protein